MNFVKLPVSNFIIDVDKITSMADITYAVYEGEWQNSQKHEIILGNGNYRKIGDVDYDVLKEYCKVKELVK
jgi:hypothetical protein